MDNGEYLGEFEVDLKDTPFADYTERDWALYWIGSYGGIDGAHHKTWVLDQVARILNGTPVIVKQRRWTKHEPEWSMTLDEPSRASEEWVIRMRDGEDGPETYDWDEGIAP
jgi:hypothetical protein